VKSVIRYLSLTISALLVGGLLASCSNLKTNGTTTSGGAKNSTGGFGDKNVPSVCSEPVSDVTTSLTEKPKIGDIHLQLGIGYMQQGKFDTALAELNQAVELMPSSADAYAALAILDVRMNRPAEARKQYRRALRIAPGKPELNNNYGYFLCQQGEYLAADKRFQCALANPLYRSPWRAYYNAGICALKAGELNQADIYLRTARQLAPDLSEALYYLADLAHQRRSNLQAADYLQRYLDSASPNANSLWLGVKIARDLKDEDMEASYTLSLKNLFPDSDQAQNLYLP